MSQIFLGDSPDIYNYSRTSDVIAYAFFMAYANLCKTVNLEITAHTTLFAFILFPCYALSDCNVFAYS